jgi:hypothetical protein
VSYSWLLAAIYVAGIAWCVFVSDARPVERLTLAVLWPVGPLALVVTLVVLLVASVVAYPLVMAAVLGAAGVLWWLFF